MPNLDHVRAYFAGDRFAAEAGAVMGGALFTLADFAFAVAANTAETPDGEYDASPRIGGAVTVSRAAQITFLGGAKGARLVAEAKRVHGGRTACYYTVDIRDDTGALVAAVTVDGFILAPRG